MLLPHCSERTYTFIPHVGMDGPATTIQRQTPRYHYPNYQSTSAAFGVAKHSSKLHHNNEMVLVVNTHLVLFS